MPNYVITPRGEGGVLLSINDNYGPFVRGVDHQKYDNMKVQNANKSMTKIRFRVVKHMNFIVKFSFYVISK